MGSLGELGGQTGLEGIMEKSRICRRYWGTEEIGNVCKEDWGNLESKRSPQSGLEYWGGGQAESMGGIREPGSIHRRDREASRVHGKTGGSKGQAGSLRGTRGDEEAGRIYGGQGEIRGACRAQSRICGIGRDQGDS